MGMVISTGEMYVDAASRRSAVHAWSSRTALSAPSLLSLLPSRTVRTATAVSDAYTGYYYGADHPMKPQRIAMTHSLILGYGLHEHMDVYRPRRAQRDELAAFHSAQYVDMLRATTPEQARANPAPLIRYGIDTDCPIFHGLFDFCRLYAGASIGEGG